MGPWQNRLLVLVLIGALVLFDNTQGQSSGTLRLVARNGQTSPSLTAGRLEVYYNGEWGTVCDDRFGTTEANVACRQLGYTEGSLYDTNVGFTSSSFATRFTQASSSTPIWFDSLDCSLSDSRLIDCASSIGVHDCTHGEDVVLFCRGDGAVRLSTTSFGSSSVSTSAGRVEVYYNGVWGSVCNDSFGQTDADVVCRQLGYPSASTYGSVSSLGYSQGSGRIWLTDLACSLSDLMLSTCTSSGFGNTFGCSHIEDVAVSCNTLSSAGSTLPPMPTTPTTPMPTVPPVTCTEFELQLGNAVHSVMDDLMTGTSRFSVSGTVEICLGGSFFSVCDEGWGQEEAQVTCNALNYPSTSYQAFPLIGLNTTRQVIAENIMCHGNETSARRCNFTAPPVSPRCYASSSAAGVECIQVRQPCINDGEINLLDLDYEGYLNIFTGDQVNVTGRVGVCSNGSYDSVCDVNWDANDAAVLCRTIIPQSTAIPVKGLSGGRDPVVLEDVRCFGNESNIANCSTSPVGQISNPVCLQPNRTAGVKCSTADDYCVDGTLRLVDGPTFYEGRVEVCRNSQWLSVCDVGVNSTLAINACERRSHLGANATAIHGSAYGPGMGPQLAFCEVYPSYTEIVPVETCTSNPGLQELCSHSRDLGVRCQPGLLALHINADEVPTLGSTSFALECFGRELPWEARLVSVGWYKSGTQLSPNDSVSTEILHDSYNPSAFNATYIFRGRATFNRPLTISDEGEYSCNVSILLTYPDKSTHLLTNFTTYILGISVLPPTVTITTNGTRNAGSRFEANCFAELPSSDLAPYTTIDYFDGTFNNLSEVLEETPDERVQLLPTRQYNATHLVRTIILDPLSHDHQGSYYCVANITVPHAAPSVAVLPVSLEVFSNISDRQIPQSFLPFGSDHGDLTAPVFDDGSTGEITLGTDVVIFGSTHNRLYVNTNGVLSFGTSYTSAFVTNFNILSSPPIIAPFWDDIDITRGGTIYYRQDSNSTITELVQKAVASEYPEAASFQPSLVFVATWDRVERFGFSDSGRVNTFQVVVASDGTWTFVRFSYGDIQWGGVTTLIGVTAGDQVNFVTHPASQSTAVLLLYNTTTTYMYRVNESMTTTMFPTTTMLPTTTTPPPPNEQTPRSFLPFGSNHGDLTAPVFDDGSTGEIVLGTDVVIFGSRHNSLYVNTNGVLSFGTSYTRTVGTNFNILSSPPIIAPFWDDINIIRGGTIYYRQDSNFTVMELVQKAVALEYPEAASFQPSLVFVATWDRVEPFDSSDRGRVNTFQVVVASDGTWTFVQFSYGDIQWGGVNTLIGVTAGDQVNFVTHPASQSTAVLMLYNTTTTYRIDESTTTMLPTTTTPPPPECSIQGEILPYLVETSHRGLRSFQGTFEICIGGLYGSVCDIGWNQLAAQTLCRDLYGSEYIAEPLYELGHPFRRYLAQHFNCSGSTNGLESCNYSSLFDTECFLGPHVAGVRCTERASPPIGVQGMCSVVVWYSPAVQSCEDIRGYEVRLYNPQSPHLNVTNHVGANGTFYIVDVDKLVSSEETYVQVRAIHSIGVGEWSEGTSLGCEKTVTVTTEMPTITTETPPRVYFELNGKTYHNNSAVSVSEIGEGTSALYCRTDKEECCGTVPNRYGQFYYPNGVQVPIANRQHGFYRNRGNQIIRLNRREGITSPTGTYRCEILNADDETVRIYITLTG